MRFTVTTTVHAEAYDYDQDPAYADEPTLAGAARFGIAVDDDNGHHVRFRLFAATGGRHLGGCGQLVMRVDEYAAFRTLLEPALTDRTDPGGDR